MDSYSSQDPVLKAKEEALKEHADFIAKALRQLTEKQMSVTAPLPSVPPRAFGFSRRWDQSCLHQLVALGKKKISFSSRVMKGVVLRTPSLMTQENHTRHDTAHSNRSGHV